MELYLGGCNEHDKRAGLLDWRTQLAHAVKAFQCSPYIVDGLSDGQFVYGAHRIFTSAEPLLLQRLLAGIASAWVFVSGGLLAAPASSRIWAGLQMVMAD